MKFALIAMLSLSVTAAFACPDLSGFYKKCSKKGDNQPFFTDFTVSQETVDGITSYTFQGFDVANNSSFIRTDVADGKTTSTTEHGEGQSVVTKTKYSCEGDAFVSFNEVTMLEDGSLLGAVTVKNTKIGSTLIMDSKMKMADIPYEFVDQFICE